MSKVLRLWLLFFCLAAGLHAEDSDNMQEQLNSVQQFTAAQLKTNESLQRELESYEALSREPVRDKISQDDIREKRLHLEQIKVDLDNLNGRTNFIDKSLMEEMKRLDSLQTLLQKQVNPLARGTDLNAQQLAIEQTRATLESTETYIKALGQQKQAVLAAIGLLQRQRNIVEALYQMENERYLSSHQQVSIQSEDKFILNKIDELERQRETLMQKKISVRENRDGYLDKNIELMIISKQLLAENNMLELTAIDRHLQELLFADLSSVSLERIQRIQDELQDLAQRSANLRKTMQENFLLENEQFALYARQRPNMPKALSTRQQEFNQNHQKALRLIENIQLNLEMIRKNTDKEYNRIAQNRLKYRYFLGKDIGLVELSRLVQNALASFAGQYAVAIETVYAHLRAISPPYLLFIFGAFLLAIIGTGLGIAKINRLSQKYSTETRLPFAKRLVLFIYHLLKLTLPYIVLLLLTIVIVYLAELPAPSSYLVILVPSLFLAIAVPNFATKLLLSSQLIKIPENSNIVNMVTLFSAIGSFLFALVMLAQWVLMDSSETVVNAFRWLFGVYSLVASYPLFLMVWRTIGHINEFYEENYIYRVLRVLFLLVPVVAALFGLLSVCGYLNIAWLLAQYCSYLLLYGLAWIGLLALYKDFSLAAKRYALKHTSNGLFWTQDVINPLNTIVRYGTLFGFVRLLLQTYQWNSNTPVIREIFAFLKTPIIGTSESQFTLLNITLMAFFIYIVFRMGSWMRSFAYRWIFAKILDLGIRNSFSAFSQYAMVTIGFLLALRIIGIDLTAFTVFAGALGVGIGFGMQTIANNFVSGILLLIERPLRNGDIITVNNYEGKVERIGMRSVTILTFNNESVILPNSDFVTKPFMNWSYSDTVLRTVLYLDLALRHGPEQVKAAFAAALDRLVADKVILQNNDFEYGIYAYNYSDRGITYRVQYFINMDFSSINDARHAVMAALWNCCRAHDFELAYPKRENFYPTSLGQFEELLQASTTPLRLGKPGSSQNPG